MAKKKRTISPEHLRKLREGREIWLAASTPEEKLAAKKKAAETRAYNEALRKAFKKLNTKKERRKAAESATPSNPLLPTPVYKDNVIREEVVFFSRNMEHKLRKRDGYGGWRNLPLKYLREKLKGELNELLVSLEYETAEEVMSECIDVANYAMFLWDIMRHGDPRNLVNVVGRTKDQGRS